MQQWWIILLQSLIIQHVVGSPTLTPEAVHSCPGETVTFTCVVTDGDRLYWEVDYSDSSWSDVSTQRYSVTDNLGKIIPHTNNIGHKFKFNLTDNTHLTSTATTTVVQEMNGTKIYCRDAVNNRVDAVIYVDKDLVIGPPEFEGTIIIDKLTNEDNYYSVNVSWKSIRPGVDKLYIIAITPPVESGSNFTTSNTSIILSVLYSQEYNISIVASNCAGSSARVTTTIGVCEHPAVGPNVTVNTYSHHGTIGSRISYNCEPGLIPDKPQTAICQSDGSWFPNPTNLECQNNTHNGNRNCSLPDSVNADSIQSHINGSLVAIINCSGDLIKTVCTTEGIWDVDITKVELDCQKNRLQELEENIMNGELPIIVATAAAGTGVIIVLIIIIILLIIAAVKLAQRQGKERNEVMNLYADPVRVDGRNTMSDFHLDAEDTIEESSDHNYEEVSDLTMGSVANSHDIAQRETYVYAELEPDLNNHPPNMAAPDNTLVEYASLNHLSLGENSVSSMSNRIPPQLSSKWHELGTAIGMDKQSLNNILKYDPQYSMQRVFEYWKENVNGKLTWRKLAETLETIELRSLSESITEEHINELDCEVNHNIGPISV